MHQPAPEEFWELARAYRVVPVWREVLADLTTPVAAFARVVGDGFLLESAEHGERWSRWSFYLDYDVVREVEHLPDTPPDDSGHPDAVMLLIGELAVYDHWHQRATLIANVLIPLTPTTGSSAASTTRPCCEWRPSRPTAPSPSTSPRWPRPAPPSARTPSRYRWWSRPRYRYRLPQDQPRCRSGEV